jgi:hypothetical protein
MNIDNHVYKHSHYICLRIQIFIYTFIMYNHNLEISLIVYLLIQLYNCSHRGRVQSVFKDIRHRSHVVQGG